MGNHRQAGIYTIDIAHGIIYHDGSAILGLDIICDHAGKIWIGTWGEGLLIIDKEKQTIKNIKKYNERIAANSIGALLEDRNKNIWFNTFDNAANNILVINPARTSLKLITGHQKRAISFFENSDGEICVGNLPGSIDFISLKNNTISTLGEDNGFSLRPWLVTEDNQGKTWAVANDTVCVINKTRDSVKNIITNATAINQLKGSLMKDENENIWIGTLDKGMILINNKAPGAEHLGKENGLTDPNIWGILEDKQSNIWIGTENGVNIYQPGKNSMAQLTHVQGLPNNNTGRFMEDDQHNIFISTAAGLR
ncbi:MAG: two-component regulator propeller domain-containing protein [Bacteroidota bacterium]